MSAPLSLVHRRLAQTIKRQAEHSAERHRAINLGTVLSHSPWRVELHDKSHVLQQHQDLQITQWVHFYEINWGIQVSDNAVIEFIHGHYVWFDVLSDTVCSPSTATVPWSRALTADVAHAIG